MRLHLTRTDFVCVVFFVFLSYLAQFHLFWPYFQQHFFCLVSSSLLSVYFARCRPRMRRLIHWESSFKTLVVSEMARKELETKLRKMMKEREEW